VSIRLKIMEKIGLIAGNRRFPIVFSEAAKKKQYHIVAVAIKGDTCAALKKYVDKIYWLGLHEFSRIFSIFRNEGITNIVMAGQISPHRLFSKEIETNQELKDLFSSMENQKADTIFKAIAEKLEQAGFNLMASTTFMEDLLPQKQTLTGGEPSFKEWEDIYFGFDLAKEIAHLDIGQTVAVKNKAIVAVEALEGTDNLIVRSGKISRGGFTLVKVSRPKQDMRYDIPVVGLKTIKHLVEAGASCLAIEAGKTLFLDKDKGVKLANQKGIVVVAV